MKLIKTTFLISLIVIGFFAAYFYMQYKQFTDSALGDDTTRVKIVVEEGMTGNDVLNKLVDEKVITSNQALYLKIYLKFNNVPNFKEGVYHIPRNLTVNELFATLQNPESPDIWITIREGSRADQVAGYFADAYKDYPESVYNKETFLTLTTDKDYIATLDLGIPNLKTLEGFLFPDKYLMPKEATEDYLIKTLVNTFKEKAGGKYTYKQVIIASMLQREGLDDNDRPMIAGIINNRLQANWLLQIDATLLYYYKDWLHVLTQAELKTDHPYNTYTRAGLIPTPICSPGLSAINAAKNPKANTYFYYLHDSKGGIHYGTTYQEHLNNIQLYLR
jgi:UPF0755 protein